MKKNWTKIAIALGPAIIIASVVWEVARVNQSFGFLIAPWSIRGYESDHGVVYAVLGVLLLIGGLAVSWEGAMKNRTSVALATYLVVAATAFAFLFAADREITLTVTTVMSVVVATILATAISLALRSILGQRIRFFRRAMATFIIVFALVFGVLAATVVGSELVLETWILVLFVALLTGGLSMSIQPIGLAANRVLIVASVAAWGVIVLSAGALRQHLIDTQLATVQADGSTGIAAQYKDVQAAPGWWLAGMGATILFVATVGLWARRRDIVATHARAKRQRAAAEVSTREIQEAAEAYAAEKAAASTN
ncbi:MAG TPA: hypothetical protein VLA29_07710 [Acidimicrobiia bacterium]|nr:hypothetical protein [Acidimicrobiia bacterium]